MSCKPHQRERVPQIFIKESTIVKKGLYFEEAFTPAMKENSEIWKGSPPRRSRSSWDTTSRRARIPPRSRSSRRTATRSRHWRYGLGKSVAFTSDASRRWGARWVPWNQYKRFWTQAVRWCQRRTSASPYQLTLPEGAEGEHLRGGARRPERRRQLRELPLAVGGARGAGPEGKPLAFEQIGPGRYRATFPTDAAGGYVVNVQYSEGGRPYLLRGGYVPPYQPE